MVGMHAWIWLCNKLLKRL